MMGILFAGAILVIQLMIAASIVYFVYSKIRALWPARKAPAATAVLDPRLQALVTDGYHPNLGLSANQIFPEVTKFEHLQKYLEYRDLWFPVEAYFTTPAPAPEATTEELQTFCLNMWLEMHFWVLLITHPKYGSPKSAWKYKTAFDNNVPDRIRRLNPDFLRQLALDNKESVKAAYERYKMKAA